METEFNLPSSLEDKYPNKTGVEITFNDFTYDPNMINVDYIYRLNKSQFYFLLEEISKSFGVISKGESLYNFLMGLHDRDEDKVYYLIQDYLDYKASDELKNKIKEFVRAEAFEEFKESFEFWVDEDDMEEYLKKEEFDD